MSKKSGKSIRGECRTEKGKPRHAFYLGTDAREAERRKELLERLWECVEAKDGTWTPLSLYIGKAIAKGATEVNVSEFLTGAFAEHAHHALANYQADYPVIRLVVSPEVEKERQAFGKILQADADKYLSRPISSVTVHQAIDDYSEFCKRTILDVATKELSDYGKLVVKRLNWLKEKYAARPLHQMDIDEILAIWKARPMTKKKMPCSIDHARGVIKTFRNFLDWLHGRYEWRKPDNYRVKPVRFNGQRQHKVSVFTRDELVTLYRYATPLERVLLLLGLNCGFSQSEIAHLRKDMLSGNYIKGARNKTGVYGEWELWPETIAALEWYAKNIPPNPEYVFANKKGLPLFTKTSGGNRNQFIANTWKRLLARVKKDEANKAFRILSFKFLRKTSGNWCRKIAGGETMRVFHARGKSVIGDDQSERYSNRVFTRVFKAQKRIRKYLAPMFAIVSEPFPETISKPSIGYAKVDRIKTLRAQGYKYTKICELLGISMDTVRRHSKQRITVNAPDLA